MDLNFCTSSRVKSISPFDWQFIFDFILEFSELFKVAHLLFVVRQYGIFDSVLHERLGIEKSNIDSFIFFNFLDILFDSIF